MLVGINYPWIDFGWDFGDPPPSWVSAGRLPAWRTQKRGRIVSDLSYFRCLGFFAVRWFLLADGTNYGMGRQGPQLNPRNNHWTFSPLAAGHPYYARQQDDFAFVLRTLAALDMKIVPVLISAKWCYPGQRADHAPEAIKGGRAAIFHDWVKRRTFFDNALNPLLAISRRYPNTIYAWELINEPEWAAPRYFSLDLMLDFIRDGAQRINNAGFRSTVGFARSRTMIDWQTQNLGLTLSQFHYYPEGDPLPRGRQISSQSLFVGEFASTVHRPWPELQQRQASQTISNRLRLIAEKGYPAAFIWSGTPDLDRATRWTAAAEDEVLSFTHPSLPAIAQNRPCPRLTTGSGNRELHDDH